jgi:Putative arginyl-tRNA:protein arginylyltransferase
MIEATPILTVMIDYYQPREDGDERLIASALTDVLGDGLSLVYSFF